MPVVWENERLSDRSCLRRFGLRRAHPAAAPSTDAVRPPVGDSTPAVLEAVVEAATGVTAAVVVVASATHAAAAVEPALAPGQSAQYRPVHRDPSLLQERHLSFFGAPLLRPDGAVDKGAVDASVCITISLPVSMSGAVRLVPTQRTVRACVRIFATRMWHAVPASGSAIVRAYCLLKTCSVRAP